MIVTPITKPLVAAFVVDGKLYAREVYALCIDEKNNNITPILTAEDKIGFPNDRANACFAGFAKDRIEALELYRDRQEDNQR